MGFLAATRGTGPNFLQSLFDIGLTVVRGGTYIAVTEGGSSLGVAGLVDFSANGVARPGLWPWGLGVGGFAGFFDIVDGRKRSAGGGALRFGAAFGLFRTEGTLAVF